MVNSGSSKFSESKQKVLVIMPTLCCVPQCNGRGGHSFPWPQKDLLKKWIHAVKRVEKWKPSRFSVVRGAHFDTVHECGVDRMPSLRARVADGASE